MKVTPEFSAGFGHTRYGQLATRLQEDIAAGRLAPGARLPSVRDLCASFQASPATVTHALHLLEDAGLIEARARSGFYVRHFTPQLGAPEDAETAQCYPRPVALNEQRALMHELRENCHSSPLMFIDIAPAFYPGVTLQRIMTQQARRDVTLLTGCNQDKATLALKEQLVRRARQFGCNWEVDEVVIVQSQRAAIYSLLRLLTKPGDVVAIQAPTNMTILDALDLAGVHMLEIPAHSVHGLSVEALAFALKREKIAACLFTANFPHPTGSLMSDEAKRRTVELLAEHGVPLIEDDSNGELYFGKTRPLPFKAFDETGSVYYCSEIGDLVAPGFWMGYAVTGKQRLIFHSSSNAKGDYAPPLLQQTVASFMASGLFEPHLRRLRSALHDQTAAYRALVVRYFPDEICMGPLQGGPWLWMEMPRGFDTVKLLRSAIEHGIRFAPGCLFGTDHSFSQYLRIATCQLLTPEITADIVTLGKLAKAQLAAI